MALTVLLLIGLAAVLGPSAGQQPDIASVSTDRPDQQKEITDVHNDFRRNVKPSASNMLKMKWDPIAADKAQLWAKECTFQHSPVTQRTIDGTPCGENLYMSTGLTTWPKAIDAWHSEVKDFKYGTGSTTGAAIGHYTQVVWYRSSRIDLAMMSPTVPCQEYTYPTFATTVPSRRANPCPHNDKFGNCPDLKRDSGCDHPQVKEWCPASCQCTNEII
ncbi:cysteine-rich venom protein-like [Sphaerodactylus townsendi]|uniref:cysteine-rich venom protein-like n=1 Tax=Sphaerodactylus townsendi TaxID=933632 RepID=UPI002025D066|nr:cysteine-rich venom protein-like [Sphaerodactylus townsendi]